MRGWVIFVYLLFVPHFSCAALLPPVPRTLEELCQREPEMVERLFRSLDLDRPGLDKVGEAFRANHLPEACRRLIVYYKSHPQYVSALSIENPSSRSAEVEGNEALRGIFTFQEVTAAVPVLPSGCLDWGFRGPKDDFEWWGMLQRNAFIPVLIARWEKTKDERYAAAFSRYVTDWIVSNPEPDDGLAADGWETMLIARRLTDAWISAFFILQPSRDFTDVARIMMLASAVRQTEFLMPRLTEEGNHLNAELLAIATTAAAWPELRRSREWLDFAVAKQREELEARVYPDGSQEELSNHYQIVVANHTERLANLLHYAKHPAADEMYKWADLLWSAVAAVARPDGYGPLNNDGDLENNFYQINIAREGRLCAKVPFPALPAIPLTPYRRELPWAGEVILGVPKVGQIFFNVGPLGSAHQHYDGLHLSLFVQDREVLVDCGRYTYKVIDSWRKYFTGPWGHNVIIVDGGLPPLEPLVGMREVKSDFQVQTSAAVKTEQAWGEVSFRGTGFLPSRPVTHRRSIVQLDSQPVCWVVLDEIESAGSHRIEIPWHFHPSCHVQINPVTQVAETVDPGHGNLQLVPVPVGNSMPDSVRLVKGQRWPFPLGWYSPEYNVKQASPVALYEKEISGSTILVWLLVPVCGEVPQISACATLREISSRPYLNLKIKKISSGNFEESFSLPLGEK